MRNLLLTVVAVVMSANITQVIAADNISAPESLATCSACHGINGISLKNNVPNLAGQKQDYIVAQLKAFKGGKRSNPLMNAIASGLGDDDITALAAFFSSQPADGDQIASAMQNKLNGRELAFPVGFQQSFTRYGKANRADNKQVRWLYANKAAVDGYKANGVLPDGSIIMMEVYKAKLDADGKPVTAQDGFYQEGALAAYAMMQNQKGSGADVPIELRNADWQYDFFTPNKEHKAGINKAECLACHQPLGEQSYMFSYELFETTFK